MPLYMDIHKHIEGLTADGVTHAHQADLNTQKKYGVKYLQYWFDEANGKVFCLIDAPNKKLQLPFIGKHTDCWPMRLLK